MNTLLWIVQVFLALVFLGSGAAKSTMSKERMLETGQTGVRPYRLGFIRFIAACELLGAVGLVVPWATQIAPRLTALAALGLAAIMVGAARSHLRLHEPRSVAINIVLLALSLTVAIGRWQ